VQNIQEIAAQVRKGLDRIDECKDDPAEVQKTVNALKAQLDNIVQQANLATAQSSGTQNQSTR